MDFKGSIYECENEWKEQKHLFGHNHTEQKM